MKNKVIVVTGGASGIGAAIVTGARTEGATVYITDIQDDLGRSLTEETGAIFLHHDVAS